jgi:uncharacterized protein (TIGR01777 family)
VNTLVTGSSGLIGTALTGRLEAGGHRVTRLVRHPSATGGGRRQGTADVSWDPDRGTLDRAALERAGPFDAVVHLAGAGIGDKRWSPARKQVILRSRTASTSLLVDAVVELTPPPPVLVSASAVGYYGDRGDEVLTERSAPGSGFLAEVCSVWEAAAAPAVDAGIRTVLLRTGIVLSADGGVLGRQLPLFRLGLGGRIGSGHQYRSWITLEDEVSVILACIEDAGLSGPVNATAPHPVTDAELARALGAALHRPVVLAVPGAALRLALGSEMATDLVLGGQRVLPDVLQTRGFAFAHAEMDQAVRSVLGAGR